MSVGLSFFSEYRSEKAVEGLHSQIRHLALSIATGGWLRSPLPRSFMATWCTFGSAMSFRPIGGCWRCMVWSAMSLC